MVVSAVAIYLRRFMNDECVMAICEEIDYDNALEECMGKKFLTELWSQTPRIETR